MSTIEYSSTEHDHELKIYIEEESVQSDDGILTAPEVRAIYVKMKELGCYDKK
jgi:urease accessory protein UreE